MLAFKLLFACIYDDEARKEFFFCFFLNLLLGNNKVCWLDMRNRGESIKAGLEEDDELK